MKLLRKTALLDDETVKSNIANNNGDSSVEEFTNVGHQFHFVYSPVLRIQKAWRSYKENKLTTNSKVTPEPDFQSLHFSINPKNKLSHQLNIENNNFEFCHEMSNNIVGKSNAKDSAVCPFKLKIEPDSDSAISDHSDATEASTDINLIEKQDLYLDNLSPQISLQKSHNEDEEDFQKRVRKINLLSLAQEFAALKKMNSDALPFDLHQDKYKEASSMSDTASEADELIHDSRQEPVANEISLLDINNGNSLFARPQEILSSCCSVPDIVKVGGATNEDDVGKHDQRSHGVHIGEKSDGLPIMVINDNSQNHVLDENLHAQWKNQLISEQGSKQWIGNREEIRKKLAFYEDEELDPIGNLSGLCFVNEVANDTENVKNKDVSSSRPDIIPPPRPDISVTNDNEDFFTKQARLQTEAKMALAQVRPMAHMQLQLEKQKVTKSPLADIVGMPGYGDGVFKKLTKPLMSCMNIAQLQVLVNDLHARIESLNNELMQQLLARDDLHMAQDAMLVDIEDLTGRAREFATRVNKRRESDKYV